MLLRHTVEQGVRGMWTCLICLPNLIHSSRLCSAHTGMLARLPPPCNVALRQTLGRLCSNKVLSPLKGGVAEPGATQRARQGTSGRAATHKCGAVQAKASPVAPLTSFDWSPHDLQQIITSSTDCSCCLWHLEVCPPSHVDPLWAPHSAVGMHSRPARCAHGFMSCVQAADALLWSLISCCERLLREDQQQAQPPACITAIDGSNVAGQQLVLCCV